MDPFFSTREKGEIPRIIEEIPKNVWDGISGYISTELDKGSFGSDFPLECQDGGAITGSNLYNFEKVLKAEIPDIIWPPYTQNLPDTYAILDFIEFCYAHIADPIQGDYHQYFQHFHLSFDKENGKALFRTKINRMLIRNGIAFDLNVSGQIERVINPVLKQSFEAFRFNSGDKSLDDLLKLAVSKFLKPDPMLRREALEKVWDAWERAKTIESGKNKKVQAKSLLHKAASESKFRELLEKEAMELTSIGNSFMIRHTETSQTEIENDNQVDYLFQRMFSLIVLLLESR